MTKHAKNSNHLQAVDMPKAMAVEIPLPLLEAFGNIENSFFELCIDSGQQVLQAMMEQDREDLCGPRWKRDPDRRAGRRGHEVSHCLRGWVQSPHAVMSGTEWNRIQRGKAGMNGISVQFGTKLL